MSLKSVNEKAGVLEAKLKGKLFLAGSQPSAEDVKAFNDLLGADNINLYRWAKNVASFSEAERKAWGAPVKVAAPAQVAPLVPPTQGVPAAPSAHSKSHSKSHAAKPEAAKPSVPKKAAAAKEEDDIDLFGEITEEDKAALAAKKAADAEHKAPKKGVIAKSSILFDIKPWDDTIDLEALSKKLKAIERPGLLWGDHKLEEIAYGVMKLQQLIVIEDDKVSGDDLEDIIMGFEDEVQSMDIVAWNKI